MCTWLQKIGGRADPEEWKYTEATSKRWVTLSLGLHCINLRRQLHAHTVPRYFIKQVLSSIFKSVWFLIGVYLCCAKQHLDSPKATELGFHSEARQMLRAMTMTLPAPRTAMLSKDHRVTSPLLLRFDLRDGFRSHPKVVSNRHSHHEYLRREPSPDIHDQDR